MNTNIFIYNFHKLPINEQINLSEHFENDQPLTQPEIDSLSSIILRLPRQLLDQAQVTQQIRSLDPQKRVGAINNFFQFLAQNNQAKLFLLSFKSTMASAQCFQALNPIDQRLIARYILKETLTHAEAKITAFALSHLPTEIYTLRGMNNERPSEESSLSPMAVTPHEIDLTVDDVNMIAVNRFRRLLQAPQGELVKKLMQEVDQTEFLFSPRQMLIPTANEWQSLCDGFKGSATMHPELSKFLVDVTRLLNTYNAIPKFEWNDRIEKLQALKYKIDTFLQKHEDSSGAAIPLLRDLSNKIGNKIQYIVEINKRALLIQKEYYPIDIQIDTFADSTPQEILIALENYQTLTKQRETCPHTGALYDLDQQRLVALTKLYALIENKTLKDKKNQKVFLPELVKEKIQYLTYLQRQGKAELDYGGLPFKDVQKQRLQFLKAMMNLQKGGRTISQGYWLEKNDPLHRFWSGTLLANTIVADWKNKSPFTSFFTYLETIENKAQVVNATDESRVTYFDAEGRKALRLDFYVDENSQTRIVRNGQLADTTDGTTVLSGRGFNIFIVDTDGEMYIGPQIHGRRHHSGFMAGNNIRSGGEIVIKEGRLVLIKNGSGHYLTEQRHIFRALQLLHSKGINLKGIDVSLPQKSGDGNIATIKTGPKTEAIIYATYDAHDYLMSHGRCLAKTSTSGWNPAHEAAWNGKPANLVAALDRATGVEKRALIDAQDNNGNTPLHLAVKNRLHFMLTPVSQTGRVQYISSWEEHQNCAQALLQAGADINAANQAGSTPLHEAIRTGNEEAIQFLLSKQQTRLDLSDQNGLSALSLAAKEASLEILQLLLNDPRTKSSMTTPEAAMQLLHASISGSGLEKTKTIFDFLERQQLLPENKNALIFTFVAKCQNLQLLPYLLSKGLNIDAQDARGRTPLHLATILSEPFLIQELIRHKASLNQGDQQGQTALHLAVMYARTSPQVPIPYIRMKTIKMLLELGADISKENQAKQTPLETPINGSETTLQQLVENQKEGFGELLPAVTARGIQWVAKERKRVMPLINSDD